MIAERPGDCRTAIQQPASGNVFQQGMKLLIVPLAVIVASAALAEAEEDTAHRADRLRTIELNRRAGSQAAQRSRASNYGDEQYRAAQDRYERQMKAWRSRVSACRAGDWDACG